MDWVVWGQRRPGCTKPLLGGAHSDGRHYGTSFFFDLLLDVVLSCLCYQQEIMEKFEFLPIKCRTVRARQLFHKKKAAAENEPVQDETKPLKSKVGIRGMN